MKSKVIVVFLLFMTFPLFSLTEEDIYFEATGTLTRLFLSNDLEEIEDLIYRQTGRHSLQDLRYADWRSDSIPEKIQEAMNRYNMNYSVYFFYDWGARVWLNCLVYRRFGQMWFYYGQTFQIR